MRELESRSFLLIQLLLFGQDVQAGLYILFWLRLGVGRAPTHNLVMVGSGLLYLYPVTSTLGIDNRIF